MTPHLTRPSPSLVAQAALRVEEERADVLARFPVASWPELPLERYALGSVDEPVPYRVMLEYRIPYLGGAERDTIVFSTVIADGAMPSTVAWLEGERNLVNVAFSRGAAPRTALSYERPCTEEAAVGELTRADARARGGGAGLFNVISVMILVVGVVVIGIAAALLARTLAAAQSIDNKAQAIARNAGQINVATNSVTELNRTNELAASILQSTKPLQGQLNTVDAIARDIAGLAKSINETAGTINATAGTINSTAGTINNTARDIATTVGTNGTTEGTASQG
ncbi:MAG: hypothetical protein ACRDS9_15110 [Pseudonocardiaceae bacterium]